MTVDPKEQQVLLNLSKKYTEAKRKLDAIEKRQLALMQRVQKITEDIAKIREVEELFMVELSEKYDHEFTANELYEIINNA